MKSSLNICGSSVKSSGLLSQIRLDRGNGKGDVCIRKAERGKTAEDVWEEARSGSGSGTLGMVDPYRSRFLGVISRRRFWFVLFVTIYGALVCSSWKTVRSVVRWEARKGKGEGEGPGQGQGQGVAWPAVYASVVLGAAFGVLAMVAMAAVALPAMLLTWITILVMLAFAGRPRPLLVLEGRRITRDIASFALKIMLKEGNLVAASCAIFSFFLFIHSHHYNDDN